MTNELRFRATLDDKVSGGLDKIGGKSQKLASTNKVTSLGMTLMAGAVAGTGAALLGLAMKAADEEVGIARLGASLKANVKDWDGNTDAIERTISKREELAFSDDDLRESLALLVGSTKDVSKAWELQSTAMDLARLKNISLAEASTALIRIEGGSFKTLKALIGSTKDITTAEEALAAVRKVAAGQADAYAATTKGKLDRLAIAWEDLQETAGGAVIDIADGFGVIANEAKRSFGIDQGMMQGMGGLRASSLAMGTTVTKGFEDGLRPALAYTKSFPQKVAWSLLDGQDDVLAAAQALKDAETQPFLSQKELREALNGKGSLGKQLYAGLNSARPTVREAARRLRQDIIDQLTRGGTIEVNVKPVAEPGHPGGGRASGGPVDPWETYTVGEHGPETLVMGSNSGTIIPNGGGGGSGGGSPVTLNIQIDKYTLARVVDERLYYDYSRSSPSAVRK